MEKIDNKWKKKFLSLTETIELELISKDNPDIQNSVLKNKEKYKEQLQLHQVNPLTFNDKPILINGKGHLSYVLELFEAEEELKKEIQKNLGRIDIKHKALNYLEDLLFEFTPIIEDFYMQEAFWTELDNYFVFFYNNIHFKKELENKLNDSFLHPKIIIDLEDIFRYSHSLLLNLIKWIELNKRKIQNISEKDFKKIPGTILALMYHYLIEANKKPRFVNIQIKNNKKPKRVKMTLKDAMKQQLEKDGYEYSGSFPRYYSEIGNGTVKDVKTYKNISRVLTLLDDKDAIQLATDDLDLLVNI